MWPDVSTHPPQNKAMARLVLFKPLTIMGASTVENPNLTDWLEMVWNALNEPDEVKRDQLLRAADVFLQEDGAWEDEPAPARFVARRDTKLRDVVPEGVEGKKIAVVTRTAHEQYLKAFFTEAELKAYPNMESAREALRKGDADLVFGDGVALAFWLNGTDSANCCKFVGGPFTESRYFGEGIGIAVKRGNETLRLAFNWALFRLWEKGRFTDLWLRYFPISPF